MDWEGVGVVVHYFDKIGVAVLDLQNSLEVGEWIGFVVNGELLFEQEVTSMQIDHQDIDVAYPGDNIGLKIDAAVDVGTEVYKAVQ